MPSVWAVEPEPSRHYAGLLLLTGSLGGWALWISAPGVPLFVAGGLLLLTVLWQQHRRSRMPTRIALLDDDRWQISTHQHSMIGSLTPGGYRSAHVVVLAFRSDVPAAGFRLRSRRQYQMIWRDSVSADEFSWIHWHLHTTPHKAHKGVAGK